MAEKEEPLSEKEEELTVDEVWTNLAFAQDVLGLGGMTLTVDMINAALKDITLVDTGEVTEDQVDTALAAPKQSEQELVRISESFELTSSLYKRLLSYLGNMLSFDFTYTCLNAEPDDYEPSKEKLKNGKMKKTPYQKDEAILREFMDRFDYKGEFAKVVRQLFRQEAFFSVFRDEGSKYVFQELPQDRCLITGRFPYGLLFSFDYMYFLQPGVDIDLYPPIFKETYAKFDNKDSKSLQYIPAPTVGLRGEQGFSFKVDCSPIDNFFCFKLTPEQVTRSPYFMGMFQDIIQDALIRGLQKNSYMAAASKLIIGEVPLTLDSKVALKDRISITPKMMGKFLGLIKSAINSEAIKFSGSPLQNPKAFEWKSDNDLQSSHMRTTLGSAGASTNLLFANDIKPNTVETQLSLAVDEILVKQVYPQLNDFINWMVNKETSKFKFSVKFEGTNFYTDRERRLEEAILLADRGIVLPQKLASGAGMSPFELERQMDMGIATGFVDKLTPILMSGQMPSEESAGAPKKKDGDLSESGEQTKSDGGNLETK